MGKKQKPPPEGIVPVAENRRARHDYEIVDTYEAGLVLLGTEVKSLRDRKVDFKDAYAILKGDEAYILGLSIQPWSHGTHFNHEADRTRKLLLSREELDKLHKLIKERGFTLIPLKIYFKEGWAKILLGVAKGKSQIDKRATIKKRESDREVARALRRGNR